MALTVSSGAGLLRASARVAIAALFLACMVALGGSPLRADYVMGPAEVNASLKKMARARASLREGAAGSVRAEALLSLAAEAEDLAAMINAEMAAHGFDQRPLIDLAVERSAELGVRIYPDASTQGYAYDRAALVEYLELQPSGPNAAVARFLVLERAFAERDPTDEAALTKLVREAGALRAIDGEMACELDYFVAMSYMSLSQLGARRGREASMSLRAKAAKVFGQVSKNCPYTPEATLSRRELQRIAREPRAAVNPRNE